MNLRRRAVPVMGGTGKDVRCPADGQPVTGNGTMPVTSRARAGGPDGFSNSPRVSWRAQNPLQKSCVGWFVPLIRLPLDRITSRWPEPVHARATAILAAAIATGICRSLHGHAR